MQSDPNPTFEAHLRKMRHEIEQNGEALVGDIELRAFSGETSDRGQWEVIAKIAIAEGWSFTFFPNGSVRFAKLDFQEPP